MIAHSTPATLPLAGTAAALPAGVLLPGKPYRRTGPALKLHQALGGTPPDRGGAP